MDISIGKYTLESLTLGMYLTPEVIFREYIQNSIDSIDDAVEQGVLKEGQGSILIQINKSDQRLTIEDNGLGVKSVDAPKLLLDVGNSTKSILHRRGFRGIGRFSGLSHCGCLVMRTSYADEALGTKISFDCNKLKKLLSPELFNEYDLAAVLTSCVSLDTYSEASEAHYFQVMMDDIDIANPILDPVAASNYISEHAPLPYDPEHFSFGEKIESYFRQHSHRLEAYNIFLRNSQGETRQLFKAYADHFLADKRAKVLDHIKDINIISIHGPSGDISSIMWYGETNLLGSVVTDSIKGLRFRKGNILVGGKSTVNRVFKEERFNGWFIGEVFVLDPLIIPNSRRDEFEDNLNYRMLLAELATIGTSLSKSVRDSSNARNKDNQRALQERQLSLLTNATNGDFQAYNGEMETLRQLDILTTDPTKSITRYDVLNLNRKLSGNEKKLLERVFDVVLDSCGEALGQQVIYNVLKAYN